MKVNNATLWGAGDSLYRFYTYSGRSTYLSFYLLYLLYWSNKNTMLSEFFRRKNNFSNVICLFVCCFFVCLWFLFCFVFFFISCKNLVSPQIWLLIPSRQSAEESHALCQQERKQTVLEDFLQFVKIMPEYQYPQLLLLGATEANWIATLPSSGKPRESHMNL